MTGLIITATLPTIATVLIIKLQQKTKFGKASNTLQQVIIGLLFGVCSILGTVFGYEINETTINVRDAAPLVAGLVFGPGAGLISGLLGATYRFFSTYWGNSEFTQLACTLGTLLSTVYVVLKRRFVHGNQMPAPFVGIEAAIFAEILHMQLIPLTHWSQLEEAISLVSQISKLMISAVVGSTFFAMVAAWILLNPEKVFKRRSISEIQLESQMLSKLFAIMAVVCLVIIVGLVKIQTYIADERTSSILADSLTGMENGINSIANDQMRSISNLVAMEVNSGTYDLDKLKNKYSLTTINIVDANGIIIESTDEDLLNLDFHDSTTMSGFLCLLEGSKSYVAPMSKVFDESDLYMKCAGSALLEGFVQIGYDEDAFYERLNSSVTSFARNIQVGTSGGLVVYSSTGHLICAANNFSNTFLSSIDLDTLLTVTPLQLYETNLDGVKYYCAYKNIEGYNVLALMSLPEARLSSEMSNKCTVLSSILLFELMFSFAGAMMRRGVIRPLNDTMHTLHKISDGDLSEKVDVYTSQEFTTLTGDINTTVDTLKGYIDAAENRFKQDLKTAKTIQLSVLPSPVTKIMEEQPFDLFATMDPAKEVGGDFYDFYMTDGILNFLIADVSGKGIPAAMFMMRSKAIIKDLIEKGIPLDEAIYACNNVLTRDNDACMFLTVWAGRYNPETGQVVFVCAGHNTPIIKKADGTSHFIMQDANFVMAAVEDFDYKLNELTLKKGDTLILYTDGVTEAINENEEQYSDARLLKFIENTEFADSKDICKKLRQDVADFANTAEQFDDITILSLKI